MLSIEFRSEIRGDSSLLLMFTRLGEFNLEILMDDSLVECDSFNTQVEGVLFKLIGIIYK